MSIKSVAIVSVCTALLAASAAVPVSSATLDNSLKLAAVEAANNGYKFLLAGRAKRAIKSYTRAIESRKLPISQLGHALLNRALARQNLGQHKLAVEDYKTALRLDTMSTRLRAVALYNRGVSFQKLDRPAMAIEDYTSALFLDPKFGQAYYSRANVLRKNGQYLFAISDYEKALKNAHPVPYLVFYGKALAYENLHRPVIAQKALLQALAIKPDFLPAKMKLAQLSGRQPAGTRIVATSAPAPRTRTNVRADDIVTGSVEPATEENLVVRKAALPAAVAPSAAPGRGAAPARVATSGPVGKKRRRKLYTGRIIPETNPAVRPAIVAARRKSVVMAAPVVLASTAPVSAPAPASAPAAAKSPDATPPAPGVLKGWTIQLSSQVREDAAWNVWKKLKVRHKKLFARQSPVVVKAVLAGRGTFYRLRLNNIASRKQASRLCSRLKRRGTRCFISFAKG